MNEEKLYQHSRVVWLTGLPSAGKTTIANAAILLLRDKGILVRGLDGDEIRNGLNKDLGFSEAERFENIRRIAEVSKLFADTGVVIICSFITPTEDIREMAKNIVGKDYFIEVFVNAPLDICESRDVKGLYQKARKGEILNFTGISSPFQKPANPDLEIKTNELTVEQSVQKLVDFIFPKILNLK